MRSSPTVLSCRLTLICVHTLRTGPFLLLPLMLIIRSLVHITLCLPTTSSLDYRSSTLSPNTCSLKLLLTRLEACWKRHFCPTWSQGSHLFQEVLNHQKSFQGPERQSLLLTPAVQSLVVGSIHSASRPSPHWQDWGDTAWAPCTWPSPLEPCNHVWYAPCLPWHHWCPHRRGAEDNSPRADRPWQPLYNTPDWSP